MLACFSIDDVAMNVSAKAASNPEQSEAVRLSVELGAGPRSGMGLPVFGPASATGAVKETPTHARHVSIVWLSYFSIHWSIAYALTE